MNEKEFSILIHNDKLIGEKKICVDQNIFTEFKSFKEFSFKLEKDNPNYQSNSSFQTGKALLDSYEQKNITKSNHLNSEYAANFNIIINYIECSIYLGKHIIILYDIQLNIIIFCKYIIFDKYNNYYLMKEELVLKYEK